MPVIKIKHWYTGAVIFSCEAPLLKNAVEMATRENVSLDGASLIGASLDGASLDGASLMGALLIDASLNHASLNRAILDRAILDRASLNRASLNHASLNRTLLNGASLIGASLNHATLDRASLIDASLNRASLDYASLSHAILDGSSLADISLDCASMYRTSLNNTLLNGASLRGTFGLIKGMGVEPGNIYWKRFDANLINNGYQFVVGRNDLRPGETFNADDRILCASPGFHFASRSWCALSYPTRPLEARVRIPVDAQINEPWATNGKASASAIEILQVFDTATGEDVTAKYHEEKE